MIEQLVIFEIFSNDIIQSIRSTDSTRRSHIFEPRLIRLDKIPPTRRLLIHLRQRPRQILLPARAIVSIVADEPLKRLYHVR